MTTDMAVTLAADTLEKVVVKGDLKDLTSQERLLYYSAVCTSIGLNPLTQPFEYIYLNNKLRLYARKEATDQLRELHGVSVTKLEKETTEGVYCVTAYVMNAKGRTDSSLGAVSIEGLKGEAKANAMMKSETKAKRRATLSICGLGMLDETEVETIPGATRPKVDHTTGEILDGPVKPAETVDTQAERLFPSEPDEARVVLGRIEARWDKVGAKEPARRRMWEQVLGTTPYLSPEADPAALGDLLKRLGS